MISFFEALQTAPPEALPLGSLEFSTMSLFGTRVGGPFLELLLRVLFGSLVGVIVAILCLALGVVRMVVVAPLFLASGVRVSTGGTTIAQVLRFAGGYGLSFTVAGAVAGLLSPVARWPAGRLAVGVITGIVGMAGIAALRGEWAGLSTFANFSVWGLGSIFGLAGVWGYKRASKDLEGLI